MPEIIAVRRNLSPGAVFFRQIGRVVEYSLDRVTWFYAFELPRGTGTTISQTVYNTFADKTIQEFIDFNANFYSAHGSITTTNIDQIAAGAGRIERNLCSASKALAAAAATTINAVKEEQGDDELRWENARLKIAGGVASTAGGVAVWAKWIGPKWGGLIVLIGTAMAAVGEVTDYILAFDNVPDLLDADDVDTLACYIYRATQNNPNIGRDGLKFALNSMQLPDLPPLPQGTDEAFRWIMELSPELYSEFLAMTLDMDEIGCDCGGCELILPEEVTINNGSGYLLLTGGVKTTATNAPYGGNYKALGLSWQSPSLSQVDRIELNYVTTQYLKSTAVNWGTTTIVGVDLIGTVAPAKSYTKQITEIAPVVISNTTNQGGIQKIVFDLTSEPAPVNGAGLVSMNINHRVGYAVNGLGADTVFTGGRVCYRGP